MKSGYYHFENFTCVDMKSMYHQVENFTCVDMKSGYHQVKTLEQHKERTAFTMGPIRFYQYNRTPFGLTNSPAIYEKMIEECLFDLHLKICCIFIDDVINFSKPYGDHFDSFRLVFDRFQEHNMKLTSAHS